MRVSPNGGTGEEWVTFLGATLLYGDCHSASGLSRDIPIIETCVWKTYVQLLRNLNGLKRTAGGQDMHISPNGSPMEVRLLKGLTRPNFDF